MKPNKELAQFKLSNGSEVVCEVLEWPSESDNQLIARNAMTIINFEYDGGDRMYAFRPFINFLEDENDFIIINSDHIISVNRPRDYLIDQYHVAIQDCFAIAKERVDEYRKDKLEGLRRITDAMAKLIAKNNDDTSEEKTPSAPSNVIPFPFRDDDTIH